MSDAVIEAAHRRYVEACWDDLEARWRLRAGGRLIVRGHSHTGGTVADTKVGETLDGMTVEQLRDLARRAEAAAKVQEDQAQIPLKYGCGNWLLGLDGRLLYNHSSTTGLTEYYKSARALLMDKEVNSADLAQIIGLLSEVAQYREKNGRSVTIKRDAR